MKLYFALACILLFAGSVWAQTGTIRGNVYDQETGAPILFANIRLADTPLGTNTDDNGFFSLNNVPVGSYTLIATYLGYDSTAQRITLAGDGINYQRIVMTPNAINLTTVDISGQRERARSEVNVSTLTVTPKEIKSLPSAGGEADIAQYLPILPGIISSGDQGGQLYIRGGSPVQNKILLDGMTIYNPFHSIGLFSVFETETVRSIDVLTGGFNAQYGGRISAVVDIKTREGNKQRFGGLVSASPFQAKALIEGPIKKLDPETGNSISFLFTAKHSYLNETSALLYPYATDTTYYAFAAGDTSLQDIADLGLPFQYTDFYGKVSFVGGGGSKLDLFGMNFRDRFDFVGISTVDWTNSGGGAHFILVPPNSDIVMDGTVAYSKYDITSVESDGRPKNSQVVNYTAALNFTYYGLNNQFDYGFEFTGFNTDFSFTNVFDIPFQQRDFTTEIAGYVKYRQQLGRLVIDPGLRFHYYASQSKLSIEPRFGLKYNATDHLRFKMAGGLYSQNLISTVSEQDVVNFFVGFLAGPEQMLFLPNSAQTSKDRIQRAFHGIAGVEVDLNNHTTLNVEPYYKGFTQLISINRNKLRGQDPDFQTETGEAYGVDLSLRYERANWYAWLTYSLAKVNRDDGEQVYPTIFDRRHNVNALLTYAFGADRQWSASLRWNLGSGFPFTRTQGFYEQAPLGTDLLTTDILTGNFDIGTILSEERNDGRLSYYHRLDASLKRQWTWGKYGEIEANVSVTNLYNRDNVFYVDRMTNRRVNQLPVLPSAGLIVRF
ncbi:TonB-dependent receptor [Flavilitoribacter nigricans DSM 23189 = NBRC 102662]|uniref:TonB-dependent receptor n=2 Tax=Flavilitoribacter TaxID=2762562 RepID=A0A2D0NGU5_FLAN2|nr:TonB-dependent receptor [Flavilitoribacter nigricans DSM 23189 = NBRC 102662]